MPKRLGRISFLRYVFFFNIDSRKKRAYIKKRISLDSVLHLDWAAPFSMLIEKSLFLRSNVMTLIDD